MIKRGCERGRAPLVRFRLHFALFCECHFSEPEYKKAQYCIILEFETATRCIPYIFHEFERLDRRISVFIGLCRQRGIRFFLNYMIMHNCDVTATTWRVREIETPTVVDR